MTPTRIKICGLTRSVDVRDAVDAGADLLGFVFAPSPRQLSLDRAGSLLHVVPEDVLRVGLFMDQPAAEVQRVIAEVPLDLLQFHGAEVNDYCRSFGLPFVKAVAMGAGAGAQGAAARYPDATALLLDGHRPGEPGGSGRAFDWGAVEKPPCSIWLAGGLGPDNVSRAIRQLRPEVVDVSSGVEVRPGIKDPALMRDFVAAVRG